MSIRIFFNANEHAYKLGLSGAPEKIERYLEKLRKENSAFHTAPHALGYLVKGAAETFAAGNKQNIKLLLRFKWSASKVLNAGHPAKALVAALEAKNMNALEIFDLFENVDSDRRQKR